jgi:hypothetical protein
MSRAALAHDTDTQSSKSKAAPSGLRVSQPGDSFEAEADRVAETVSRGGRIAGWSLEKSGLGAIHRQAAPPGAAPAPQALPTSDILPKLAEALMATPAGKDILQKIKDNPAVKGAADFAGTPAGIIVSGSAAIDSEDPARFRPSRTGRQNHLCRAGGPSHGGVTDAELRGQVRGEEAPANASGKVPCRNCQDRRGPGEVPHRVASRPGRRTASGSGEDPE